LENSELHKRPRRATVRAQYASRPSTSPQYRQGDGSKESAIVSRVTTKTGSHSILYSAVFIKKKLFYKRGGSIATHRMTDDFALDEKGSERLDTKYKTFCAKQRSIAELQ
jgi:hypothetical protein